MKLPQFTRRILQYNPSRVRLEAFVRRAAQNTPAGCMVLDAGAGEGFYKTFFDAAIYHATDFGKVEKAYGHLHFISDLKMIPIADQSYDVVICTQVFEHLPEPALVIAELFRVLKPGGRIWFSAPFFFPEHEVPYDFYRYTRYGLRFLFEKAGFQMQEIRWLEGYFGSLGFQMRLAAHAVALAPSAYPIKWFGFVFWPVLFLIKLGCFALAFLFYFFEMQTGFVGEGFGKNFCGMAVKPRHGAKES